MQKIRIDMGASVDAMTFSSDRAAKYLSSISSRKVAPSNDAIGMLTKLHESLPDEPSDPLETIALLDEVGSPATMATAAGRFFGLVVGGSLPASLGARVLCAAWDQLVTTDKTSPIGFELEKISTRWVLDILNLPRACSVGFLSGSTMGNFMCIAAARHQLLERNGWDVERQGLFDAPKVHIVASEEIHVTVKKVLSMLGLGTDNIDYVKCDADGAMLINELPVLTSSSLVLTQAGNVNSGACDPIGEISDIANEVGAWVHVDGAFGLWAAASESKRHLLNGFNKASSWVTDGHKWLNTPYDCGIAICKYPLAVHAAMSTVAPYLIAGSDISPKDMVPELSRSARAAEVWAALRSLGRAGVEDLINRCCRYAEMMSVELDALGFTILNDVALNQVVATIAQQSDKIDLLVSHVNASGDAWFGPTHWRGQSAFRISFSSWVTTDNDVAITIASIKRAVQELGITLKPRS